MTLKRALLVLVAAAMFATAASFWFHIARSGIGLDVGDEEDRPIPVPERVRIIDGRRVITLDHATLAQNGIVTARARPVRAARRAAVTARALDPAELADLRRRYLRARRSAPALAAAVERTVAQRYGAALAAAVIQPTGPLEDIVRGRAAWLEIDLPPGAAAPELLAARDPRGRRLSLARLAPAAPPGHWFYRGPIDVALAPGDAVRIRFPATPERPGAAVPAAAVVWHDGLPWVYVRRAPHQYARVALGGAEPQADGGYTTTALTAQEEIVVAGAQWLLSEEFRARIHTEG